MILQTLTPSEEEVMQLIWKEDKIYFRDLMNAFPEPKPHQNTVSTFLKILVEKNYINIEKQGRIYLYSPSISLEDYKKHVLKKFLENYFNNSGNELLKILIDENLITSKDFDQLTTITSLEKDDPIKALVKELTSNKKQKKKDKDKKKKKKK